jgi:hypothetical protein
MCQMTDAPKMCRMAHVPTWISFNNYSSEVRKSGTIDSGGRKTMRRIMLGVSAMVTVILVQLFTMAPSALALSDTPDKTWNTNGTVFATALSEDGSTLYVGGKFTAVRENPPGVPGASVTVSNVAAIDVATGTAISTWTPQVTGTGAAVHSLAVHNGKVFIGGNFTAVGGQPRQSLAAVSATDGSVDPFAPQLSKGTATPDVYALLADDSKLYVGGLFSEVDGKGRSNLAAFDLTANTLDPAWKPKASARVRDLEFAPEKDSIFVAGQFGYMTGSNGTKEERRCVARVYSTSGNLHPWKIPAGTIAAPQQGWDLIATSTRLYGGFGASGPNYLAAFSLATGDVGTQLWRYNTVGNVQTIAMSPNGTRLFFGGHFGTNHLEQRACPNNPADRQYLSGLASVNPATGAIYCDWIPQLAPSTDNGNGAWALTATSTYLWIGGGFTHVSGVEQRNLARFTL